VHLEVALMINRSSPGIRLI